MMNNNGKIDDIEEVDATRNNIETGITRKKNKLLNLILFILAILVVLGFVLVIFSKLSGSSNNQTILPAKQDEALLGKQSSNDSLASQMEAIKAAEAAQKARDEEEQREERERLEAEIAARQKEAENQQQLENTISGDQPPPMANNAYANSSSDEQPLTPEQRRLQGQLLVSDAGSSQNNQPYNDDINDKLKGGVYDAGSARIVPDRDLLLTHGTQIPCILQTRLITDNPSILICQITRDIYSVNGKTLLVEKGSKAFGEQRSAIITGQTMAFVSWSEIDTPLGVRVRIDSLGTDNLGGAGINVWVDEKWAKRFGSAILLSFIQDSLATASNLASKSQHNDNLVYNNSERNTNDMAKIALENSIAIQPTGYANQGQQVNILVARDIDFSTVYRVNPAPFGVFK